MGTWWSVYLSGTCAFACLSVIYARSCTVWIAMTAAQKKALRRDLSGLKKRVSQCGGAPRAGNKASTMGADPALRTCVLTWPSDSGWPGLLDRVPRQVMKLSCAVRINLSFYVFLPIFISRSHARLPSFSLDSLIQPCRQAKSAVVAGWSTCSGTWTQLWPRRRE